jgi:copper chaperone CopZ
MNPDQHIVLHVVGMRSDECALNLAEHLLGVEGVDDAVVDLESRRADIDLNAQEPATLDALTTAVQEAGFQIERVDQPAFGADTAT